MPTVDQLNRPLNNEYWVSLGQHRSAIYRLEHEDGTPGDPPTFRTAVPNWRPGDVIPLPHRSLRVVEVRDDDADQAPTLVVEDRP